MSFSWQSHTRRNHASTSAVAYRFCHDDDFTRAFSIRAIARYTQRTVYNWNICKTTLTRPISFDQTEVFVEFSLKSHKFSGQMGLERDAGADDPKGRRRSPNYLAPVATRITVALGLELCSFLIRAKFSRGLKSNCLSYFGAIKRN